MSVPARSATGGAGLAAAPVVIPRFEEFQAVMRQGLRISSQHFVLHCCPRAALVPENQAARQPSCSRIGALLPKRWAKKAVRRNLLRRKIYALAAGQLPVLTQAAGADLDCIVRLRAAWAVAEYPSASSDALRQSLDAELQQLFAQAAGKLGRRAAPQPAAPPIAEG